MTSIARPVILKNAARRSSGLLGEVKVSFIMKESVEFRGEHDVLVDFARTLESFGVSAKVMTMSLHGADGGGYDYIQAVAATSTILVALRGYLKTRRASVSAEVNGVKIKVDAKDSDAAKELIAFSVVQLKKLGKKPAARREVRKAP